MSLRGLHLSAAGAPCPSPSDSYGAGGLGYAAFNQNGRCIVAATKRGFVVYSTEPFKQTFRRDLVAAPEDEGEEDARGSIVFVEMLYTCNILAVVGRGSGELWRENVCILWDDRQTRSIVEMRFASPIISVVMLREALLVVLEQKVCIYLLKGLSLVDSVVTAPNPAGLCVAVTTQPAGAQQDSRKRLTVACPALQKGTVQVLFYRISSETASGPQDDAGEGDTESSLMQTISISAHENDLCCLCLSEDGSLLASASVRGTLIRVFSAASGQLLKEVSIPRLSRVSASARAMSFSLYAAAQGLCTCIALGTEKQQQAEQQQPQQQHPQQGAMALGHVLLVLRPPPPGLPAAAAQQERPSRPQRATTPLRLQQERTTLATTAPAATAVAAEATAEGHLEEPM
ncbi:hypothetical protein ACSSS7_004282 [Eimeria intestinalis]